jgi:hypothetical protein
MLPIGHISDEHVYEEELRRETTLNRETRTSAG